MYSDLIYQQIACRRQEMIDRAMINRQICLAEEHQPSRFHQPALALSRFFIRLGQRLETYARHERSPFTNASS